MFSPPPCTLHCLQNHSFTTAGFQHQALLANLQGPEAGGPRRGKHHCQCLSPIGSQPLAVLIGAAAIGTKVSPADAAYGEAANVFGKPKTNTDFLPYNGDRFKLSIPSKWNPSREVEFPGHVLRYEDNFDANSNVSVMVTPTEKSSMTDFGSPEEFLSKVDYLLRKQAYYGKTESEGGFDPDAVATANVLETSTQTVGGKQYYFVSVLTRTADGDEGGKRQLITATVSNGKLYICKAQAGDKRWFKGARKFVQSTAISFNVA